MKYLHPVLFVAALNLACQSCNQGNAKDTPLAAASVPAAAAEKITLKKGTLQTALTIPGELIAYQQVDLYAKVTGFVKELKVDIGSKVKSGQVLMTLEAPELMSQLAAAQSRLKSQEALHTASVASYNRLLETSKTPGAISPNDLEQAEARKNADLANLEAARAAYKEITEIQSYLTIRAPFDGTVTARNINIGAYVGPGDKNASLPALVLQQQDKLRLVVSIPEAWSGYLKQGDPVTFKVRSAPAEDFTAKLTRLSGALDQRLRSQRVEADIDNRKGKLLAGTVADVSTAVASSPRAFVVPRTAIVNSAESVYLIKVVDGKAVHVPVKKGLEAKGEVEVFGDLKEGDVLLKVGSDEVKEGVTI